MTLDHITSPNFAIAKKYAEDIASGEVLANRARRLACKRFLDDLERDALEFKQSQVDFVIGILVGTVHHVLG